MMATWTCAWAYYTKLNVKQDNKTSANNMLIAKCMRCSDQYLIAKEHMRTPFYCDHC